MMMFAYHEVPQESMGFSQFELIYGHDVWGPLDILHEKWLPSQQDPSDIATYMTQLHNRMQLAKDIVHKHLQPAKEKQKTWYDQKARDLKLSEGEQVLLLLPDSMQKFHHKWQGPFTVKRQIGQVNYEIVMNPQGQTKYFTTTCSINGTQEQPFNFTVNHWKGSDNASANALSRLTHFVQKKKEGVWQKDELADPFS